MNHSMTKIKYSSVLLW